MNSPQRDLLSMFLELSRLLRRDMACGTHNKKNDLNMINAYALAFVQDHAALTVTHFAQMMNISPSTASAYVDRLCMQGWVTRTQDPKSRRTVLIRLTPKGKRALQTSNARKQGVMRGLFSVLSTRDQQELRRIIGRVLDGHDLRRSSS